MGTFNDEVVEKVSVAPSAFEAVVALVDVMIRHSIIPPQTGLAMLAKLNDADVRDRLEPAFWANTPNAKGSGNLTAAQRQEYAAHPQLTQAQWDALKSNKDLTHEQWGTLSKGPVLTESERANLGVKNYGQPGNQGQYGQSDGSGATDGRTEGPKGHPMQHTETQAARIERESKGGESNF